MSYRTIYVAIASALFLPVMAAPARANSITTYGVIITAMGNELQVQYVDKPAGDASATPTDTSNCPVGDGSGGGSLLVTPNGTGGISITPYGGSMSGTSSGTGSSESTPPAGGGSGGGDGSDGSSSTVKVPVPTPDGTPPKVDFSDSLSPSEPGVPKGAANGEVIETTVSVPVATANTPEPASLTLLALAGLGGMGFARRRRA